MSLDVYLTVDSVVPATKGEGIFIRENGQTREVTRKEWDEKFPGREPMIFVRDAEDSGEVFSANITHNLNKMASEAGIYQHLWRPEEIGITKASQLIEPLTNGLNLMRNEPERFKALNPSNGWGSYDDFLPWIDQYLKACTEYPEATISVSR